MTSNFAFGGPPNHTGNMISHNLKNLSLGPTANFPVTEALPNGMLSSVLNGSFNFPRPAISTCAEHSAPNSVRPMASRPFGFQDFLASCLNTSNGRPSILSTVSGVAGVATPLNGSIHKVADRPTFPGKTIVPENSTNNLGLRSQTMGTSNMRAAPNWSEPRFQSLNNNLPADARAAFVSSRFGATGDLTDGSDSCNPTPNSPSLPNFDSFVSASHQFSSFMSNFTRPTPQVNLPHLLDNANLVLPPCTADSSVLPEPSSEGNLPLLPESQVMLPFSESNYYSNQQFENTRKLQASGSLKSAPWILVPPVPQDTASHMRTGRVHELKARACTNRVFNAAYMDQELKQILRNRIQACLFTSEESTKEKLPRNLGAYTDLVPLEALHSPRLSVTFGLPGVCFKAWSPRFNRPMLLRRVILPADYEAALSPEAYYLAKQLSELDHPAIVGFRDIFFTHAFGDNSAILVYEYCPCSSNLQQTYMSDPMKLTSFSSPFNISRTSRPHSSVKNGPSDLGLLQESIVWSFLIQLTNGLRFIHQQVHISCGILDPTKVLIQDGVRLRINCLGLKDILFCKPPDSNLAENQAADFVQLGKLILGVACGTSTAIQASQRASSFSLLQRTYRPELVTLIRSLVTGQISSVDQLMCAVTPFLFDHLSQVYDHSDFLERQLFLEMECDRLFRLVCKLQSIVERSDRHGVPSEWSETGDRYMLKLFRDFVFHQSDQLGAPYLDLAHITTVLNKVEAGSPEKLCLVSRDNQNVIIVTYADIRQCLDTSFSYLVERHRQSRCDIRLAQQVQEVHQKRQKQQQQVTSASETEVATEFDVNGNETLSNAVASKDC